LARCAWRDIEDALCDERYAIPLLPRHEACLPQREKCAGTGARKTSVRRENDGALPRSGASAPSAMREPVHFSARNAGMQQW